LFFTVRNSDATSESFSLKTSHFVPASRFSVVSGSSAAVAAVSDRPSADGLNAVE
jgi:hypothetical protein